MAAGTRTSGARSQRPRITKASVISWLRRRFMLRLHMTWIMGGTFLAGIVATKLLADLGFHSMPWRYLTAVVLAYLVFLGLVRLWLWYVGAMSNARRAEDDAEDVDLDLDLNPDLHHQPLRSRGSDHDLIEGVDFCANVIGELRPGFFDGASTVARGLTDGASSGLELGGGGFGGGGSTGSWADAAVADSVASRASSVGGSGGGFDFDFDLDGEGLVIVLLAVVVVLSLFVAAIYVVYAAPAILGEAAFEAALAAALTRSAKRVDRPGWVGRVWRATVWPFVIVAILTVALGWYAQRQCPSAHRLMDAIDCPTAATAR